MAVTAGTIPTHPHRVRLGLVSVAFAAVIATGAITTQAHDESSGGPDARLSPPAQAAIPRSADAAERWLAPHHPDVQGLSVDAAERWLAPHHPDVQGLSVDAAERWLALG
jgi:hypothetical protein